jgi:hypothetical protein
MEEEESETLELVEEESETLETALETLGAQELQMQPAWESMTWESMTCVQQQW